MDDTPPAPEGLEEAVAAGSFVRPSEPLPSAAFTFEEALQQASGDAPLAATPSIGSVSFWLDGFRESLREVQRVGPAEAPDSLYGLVDDLVERLRDAYPGVVCRAGCSGCCDSATAFFEIGPSEWELVRSHVERHWSPVQMAAFVHRFDVEHRPRLRGYRWLRWLGVFEPLVDAYFRRQGYRCPFLEAGRCSIYAVRPLVCRMYGFFALQDRLGGTPSVYGCRMQADYFGWLRSQGPLMLPSARTVWARADRLQAPWPRGWRRKILPLWVAGWLDRFSSSGLATPRSM
ncbi:MAG: YkgJ family cysteine cluster protein [Candidatus Sericytochromatia bacterium]|nr:YkgJ family cysteine cluster protein [Candidatus Sericytochromatia bacterium]